LACQIENAVLRDQTSTALFVIVHFGNVHFATWSGGNERKLKSRRERDLRPLPPG